ncbi:molybdopterin-dependent oxidoreductase [Aliifodinibius sp. S!AR15-10]|uniref:xanthine dehydrogenase family protein molybdopterin-binding subunit n=1 Tax=Aliifodinibius sp. S!AR15-10 TaxID=2950437 RepID=UPI00285FA829|nr:molybdopterin cofactor-binding domain-containing protein [Aliifodinibius sp. S!AR15-10]MDR8391888.1 molybdopterin-dependent oxidoreductase [Aliifodinibius sp. S!AR15-10]
MASVKTHMDRRSFLKVSMSGGAGLMVGFSWLSSLIAENETGHYPDEWFAINAYINIASNGEVTIFSPNPEIGQNVKTSMPLIVAEELDVDWNDVKVEQATLDTEKYTRQLAGGSQSIRQGWESLRMAGATAKYLLVAAAAQKWNADMNDLSTEKGMITNTKTGERIGYGDIATDAASIPVPDEVELKDPKDFNLIGGYIKNVDGHDIVTGKPLFGLDFMREGTKIAMIVHPPAFGMKLKSYDASEVKSMSGVDDVFTIDTSINDPQWSDVNAFNELVVVTGKTTWQVMKAKKALNVEWETVDNLESSETHRQRLVEAITNRSGEVERQDGDPDKVSGQATKVIERVYTAPFLAHNTLEPMNFFANVTDNSAELIGPIQTPEQLRTSAAALLGMPESAVSVDMTRMGGGFGRRLYGNFGLEAAAISQKIGAPVKLIYTREDDMTQGTYRPAYAIRYRASLDDDGNLLSFEAKGTGIPSSPLFANRFPAGTLDHYKSENVEIETSITTGAWRAPRSNFVAGAEQSFIDEVAAEAGKDPIEFRLELFDRAIEDPVGTDNDYDPERYAGVLELVRDKSNWGKEMPGVYRGVSAYYCHNSYVAQVVDVVMEEGTPKIKKVWCAVDCGIVVNMEGALNQVEGGIIDGIGHSMYSQLTFKDGTPDQNNFDQYRLIRHREAPDEIEVFFADNNIDPTGLGEPTLPPISAAVANAMYKATGTRWYNQPFMDADQELIVS